MDKLNLRCAVCDGNFRVCGHRQPRRDPPPTLAEAVEVIEAFIAQYPWHDVPELMPLREFLKRAKGAS